MHNAHNKVKLWGSLLLSQPKQSCVNAKLFTNEHSSLGADTVEATGNFAPGILTEKPGQTSRFAVVPFRFLK